MAALNPISADFVDILPLTLCNGFTMRLLQSVIAFGGAVRMQTCPNAGYGVDITMPGLHLCVANPRHLSVTK